MPMSAQDVVVTYASTPAALVAFLGQPDADLRVCDLRSQGPHLPALSPELSSGLVDGLTGGRILPATWRGCVALLIESAPPQEFASLLDAAGPAYRDLLRNSELDRDLDLQRRLYELHNLYVRRPTALHSTHQETDPLFEALRVALREHKLGPKATSFGEELIAAFDLEHDLWLGKKVSIETIDALFAAGNAALLSRFEKRGPARSERTHVDSRGHTVVDQASCPSGHSGNSGRHGYDGDPGPNGAPGAITFAP